jgi:hypothetical protein
VKESDDLSVGVFVVFEKFPCYLMLGTITCVVSNLQDKKWCWSSSHVAQYGHSRPIARVLMECGAFIGNQQWINCVILLHVLDGSFASALPWACHWMSEMFSSDQSYFS